MSDNESGLGMLAGVLAGAMILVLTAMALTSFQPSDAFQMLSVSAPAMLPEVPAPALPVQPILPLQSQPSV